MTSESGSRSEFQFLFFFVLFFTVAGIPFIQKLFAEQVKTAETVL